MDAKEIIRHSVMLDTWWWNTLHVFILNYNLKSFIVIKITRVLKCPNGTKNYVRHMVVFATWWSGTLVYPQLRLYGWISGWVTILQATWPIDSATVDVTGLRATADSSPTACWTAGLSDRAWHSHFWTLFFPSLYHMKQHQNG